MNFNADKLSDKMAIRLAMRPNEVWEVDVAILDVPGRPFVVVAIDAHSRLATVAAVTSGTSDDIVAKLDDACRPFGYLEEIQIDRSFEFTSPVFREWGAQHDVAIVFHLPRHWSRATEAVLKNLYVTLGGKPAGDA
jgi:hypothetical protein